MFILSTMNFGSVSAAVPDPECVYNFYGYVYGGGNNVEVHINGKNVCNCPVNQGGQCPVIIDNNRIYSCSINNVRQNQVATFYVDGMQVTTSTVDQLINEDGIFCHGSKKVDLTYTPPSPPAGDGGGSGGGGGGGGSSCTPSWSCGQWGNCVDGEQTRTCTDVNSCGKTTGKPAVKQSCVEEQNSEEENGGIVSGSGSTPDESTNETDTEQQNNNGLVGMFLSNPITVGFGALALIIVIVGLVLVWKYSRKSKPATVSAPQPGYEYKPTGQ